MSEDGKQKIARILLNKKLHAHPNPREAYQKALGKLTINFSLLHFLLEHIDRKVNCLTRRKLAPTKPLYPS
jgi:hypothetical protein